MALEGGSVAADDITTGDAAVNLTTSSGDVSVNAPSGASVDLKVNDAKVVEVSGSEVDVKQSLHVEDTTAASSTSTGALKVAGGASIAAAISDNAIEEQIPIPINTLVSLSDELFRIRAYLETANEISVPLSKTL